MLPMDYCSLKKIYYMEPDQYEAAYMARFRAPFTKHFGLTIKQFNRKNEYAAFLCYTEEMVRLIETVHKKYEKVLQTIYTVPAVVLHQFSLTCIVDEVKSSNDIEGVYSTRRELKNILDGLTPSSRFASIISKYYNFLGQEKFTFRTNSDVRDFYDGFAHEEVATANPRNRLDGKIFRKGSVDVTSAAGKIVHRGLYPEEEITQTMSIALNILNDEEIPALVRIPIFHYLFGYIHPFYDGNGRTDRFITSYYLAQQFHYVVALRLSVIIKKKRAKYYDLFNDTTAEINRGDLTPFVCGFISIIDATFDEIDDLLKRKMEQLSRYAAKLRWMVDGDSLLQNIYYLLLQASLFYGQGITMQELIKLTKKSRATIQKRLDTIPQEHIIIRGKKTHYYKLNMLIFKD